MLAGEQAQHTAFRHGLALRLEHRFDRMLLTMCWKSWHLWHTQRRRAAPPAASRAAGAGHAAQLQTIEEGGASASQDSDGPGMSRPMPGLFSRSPRTESSARFSEPAPSRSLTSGSTTREAWQLVEELKSVLLE